MKRGPYSRYLTLAVIIALGVGVWLLGSFFSLIITAVIMAYLFTPVYERLLKRIKKPETAALLTLLITFFVIIIPLLVVILVTIAQASTLINDLSGFAGHQDFGRIAQETLDWVNNTASSITGKTVTLTYYDISSHLAGYATTFANYVIDILKGWFGGIGSMVTSTILYMYVFIGLLVHGNKITTFLQDANPLGREMTTMYIHKAQAMTKAMVKGQFTIAIVQGVTSALVLYLVGVPYAMFFLLFLTFLSIIPLGAGIITIPLGMVMMALGNIPGGLIVVLNHLIIVTNIDNFLKPKLVSASVRLHPALLLLAVFGGMNVFGFLGIIIGPVLMVLIVTTLQLYSQSIRPKKVSTE